MQNIKYLKNPEINIMSDIQTDSFEFDQMN